MFKKWILKLTALTLLLGATLPVEGTLPLRGAERIEAVEVAYSNGEYDSFLREMDTQYQSAGKAGVLRGLFESAKVAQKKHQEAIAKNVETLRSERERLDQERDVRLLEAVKGNSDLEIVRRVDSVVMGSVNREQKGILEELTALRYHIPDEATGTIENKISSLETEYYIKSLLLEVAAHRSKKVSNRFEEKKIALTFEKLNRMEEATKTYQSQTWQEKIHLAKEANRMEEARQIDLGMLKALALGEKNPENAVEEKVKEVMMDYLHDRQLLSGQIVQN